MALGNGVRVLGEELPHARSVTVALFLGAGSRLETAQEAGISHFIEHMLFKGSERRPTSREISETVEKVGGVINAETSKELAIYWVKVAQAHWRLAVDILADLVLHPRFDAVEVERERQVILDELRMLRDEPSERVAVLLDELLWNGSSLAWDVAGRPETVRQITREDLIRHYQAYYVPENAVVSVAGAVAFPELVEEVSQRFGEWQPRPKGPWVPALLAGEPRVRIESKRTSQEHVCLAVPGLTYADPERYALDLFNIVLGEGMSSRLFLELRDRLALAYDVNSYVNYYRDVGAAVVYVGVAPRRAEKAVEAITKEIAKLKADLPAPELARAKEYWKGRLILSMEDTYGVASWLGAQEMLLGEVRTIEEVMAAVDRVEPEDVVRVGKRLFREDALRLAAVGPLSKDEKLARRFPL